MDSIEINGVTYSIGDRVLGLCWIIRINDKENNHIKMEKTSAMIGIVDNIFTPSYDDSNQFLKSPYNIAVYGYNYRSINEILYKNETDKYLNLKRAVWDDSLVKIPDNITSNESIYNYVKSYYIATGFIKG